MKRRKGRPRKLDVARQPDGRVRPLSELNPTMIRRRLEGLGIDTTRHDDRKVITVAKEKKLMHLEHDQPLSVLHALGHITAQQLDAGRQFHDRYCRLFGSPHARAATTMPSSGKERSAVEQLADERMHEASLGALDRSGARQAIVELAVYLRPGWLVPALLAGIRRDRHEKALALVRKGLDALADVPRPKLSRQDHDRAAAEQFA